METKTTPDQLSTEVQTIRTTKRTRRPLAPLDARHWMTAKETALVLGCSLATVHRLRKGLLAGVERLPCVQFGRKYIFQKSSVARWLEANERIAVSA